MKKSFLFLCLLATTVTVNAQFKIHQNGRMSFNTTQTPNCPISLNYDGDPNYFTSYQGNKRFLYAACTNDTLGSLFILQPSAYNQMSTVLSVYSCEYTPTNPNSVGIGLRSRVFSAPYAYGVVGNINPADGGAGAGIVGSYNDYYPSYTLMDHKYAGFFYGDVKVTSVLTVNGGIQGSLLNQSASPSNNATILQTYNNRGESMTDLMMGLQAYTCRYDDEKLLGKAESQTIVQIDDSTTATFATRDPNNIVGEQNAAKNHFTLDATKLEEVFPDLVYEMSDGTKAINFVEMVPLLIQSINELNARVHELEGTGVAKAKKTPVTSELHDATTNKACLYQNTPNPFTAQTEIRFSLPDDARDAYICIFDMTGKMLKKMPISSDMSSITVNGYELDEGIYLYSLVVNGQEIDTRRMILTK